MKKLLFLLLSLLFPLFLQAQLVLKIDSINISKNIDIRLDFSGIILSCDDGRPVIYITTTIMNTGENPIWVHHSYYKAKMWLDFNANGKYYHEKLQWINTNKPALDGSLYKGYFGIYLKPNESRKYLFATHISNDDTWFDDPKAVRWKWWGSSLEDSEYLSWFKGILPTLKVVIYYGQNTNEIKKLISGPIDLKKLKLTTNYIDERFN